jgi:thymidylate synthase
MEYYNNMIPYKPYLQRGVYTAYHDLLRDVLENGLDKTTIHASLAQNQGSGHSSVRELTGKMLEFNMDEGFPVLPIRDLSRSFKGSLGEIIAFINGATTLEELESFGCPKIFWEQWVTKEKCSVWGLPEHHLGRGSYGGSLVHFQVEGGKEFDQIVALEKQLKNMPMLRTHVITTWNAALSMGDKDQGFNREVVVAPCHGNFVHFTLFPDQKIVHLTHTQRSADAPVGLAFNLIEWAALGLMVAHILGYKFTRYTHFLSNPQIYDIQFDSVKELLEREPRRLPTVKIREGCTAKSLKDFRREDFVLEDYEPHAAMIIPTPN